MAREILAAQDALIELAGEEMILDWRANGMSSKKIRVRLGLQDDTRAPLGGGGSRALYNWLHREPGRFARWQAAGLLAAEAHADHASEVAERATVDDVQLARLQVEQSRWNAEHLDPSTFGRKAADVTVNLGGLHLAAARDVQVAVLAEREAMRGGRLIDETVPPPTLTQASPQVAGEHSLTSDSEPANILISERYATLLD